MRDMNHNCPSMRTLALIVACVLSALVALPAWAGVAEGIAAFKAGDFKTALAELKPAAKDGDARAAFYLGSIYYRGLGVDRDLSRAFHWVKRAAMAGHAKAQVAVGYSYSNGLGVERNESLAIKWYRKAAEQGDAVARRNLGLMYEEGAGVEQDYAKALKWYRRAAEQGDVVSWVRLGEMYYYGRGPLDLNYQRAIQWWYRAARAGNGKAQYGLSTLYLQGLGVPQNTMLAFTWDLFAAKNGYREAEQVRDFALEWFLTEEQWRAIERRVRRGDMPALPEAHQ